MRDLIADLYQKASKKKIWWLVRHTAGMLGMKGDQLAVAVLGIIVRQKQVSIGVPSVHKNSEITIKS